MQLFFTACRTGTQDTGRHEHRMYETCAKEQEMEVKMEVKEGVKEGVKEEVKEGVKEEVKKEVKRGVKREVKREEIKEKRNVKDVMFFGEKFAY